FITVVEHYGGGTIPVRMFTSEGAISISPGEGTSFTTPVITNEQLLEVQTEMGGRVQLFLGVSKVRYANGFEWRFAPNPAAPAPRRHDVALNHLPSTIPRELVMSRTEFVRVEAALTDVPACLDAEQRRSSEGAVMGIAREPGHHARCAKGKWVEMETR